MPNSGIDSTTADLLYSAVHNLKGPAGRLRLLSQLLRRDNVSLDEDSQALLKHIEDSAAAVGVVADGLRNYAEICACPVRRELVDFRGLVETAIANLRNEIESVGAQIAYSGLPSVYADRSLMTWVIQELLTNALRFRSEKEPLVQIASLDSGQAARVVVVSDNGPGIDPSLSERVFLPFKKLSPAGGAGLGLTICRKIVELHGGRMWLEPREIGSEFRFSVGEASPCA